MISLNTTQCLAVAKSLNQLPVRNEFYNRDFLAFDADRETKLRIYLLAAAICHQTHSLHHPKLNLWGWDYLEFGFLKMLQERNVMLNPGYLSFCHDVDVESMLLAAFSPDGDPVNCTLDRISERAGMLVDICKLLKQEYGAKVSNLIDAAEGKLVNEGRGIYESLEQFIAFSDPLKKKITFFVKLACDAGVLYIRDQENIVPIMDYHMQRVLLRLGCVEIEDNRMRQDLLNKRKADSDTIIRKACIDAVRIISRESGHEIMKINDFFWPLGRSCCNVTTLCHDSACVKSPCTFQQVAAVITHDNCYFEETCKGARDEKYRGLWEPQVITHFY